MEGVELRRAACDLQLRKRQIQALGGGARAAIGSREEAPAVIWVGRAGALTRVGANGNTASGCDMLTLHKGCEKKRGLRGLEIKSAELDVQS